QPLHKGGGPWGPGGCRRGPQIADGRKLRWLLRPRRQRPRGCTADKRDELAAVHSITSSAATRSASGTVRSRALAVLVLLKGRYRVGCENGKPLGFSPRKIRWT